MRRDDRARLLELKREMRVILDTAENYGREPTRAELDEFDELEREARSLSAQLDREAAISTATDPLGVGMKYHVGSGRYLPASDPSSTLTEYRSRQLEPPPQDEPGYVDAFWRVVTTGDPDLLDQADLVELRTQSRATGAAGGFLVPTGFYDQVIRSLRFMGSVASLATEIRTDSGESLLVPANTAHGTASWVAENAAYAQTDETFAQVTLSAFKAGTSVIVSEELLADSAFPLDSFLATEFAERISVLEETAYVGGDGTGKPQGILDAGAAVPIVQASPGNSTTFDYTSLVNLVYAVPPQYRPGSSFLANDGAIKNMRLLKDTNGQPLWTDSLIDGQPDRFLGYPVYAHPDVPAPAASAKSIIFGNFARAYLIRRAGGFFLQRQNELYSNNGQVGFRGYERVDGRVVLANALRIGQHSAT